MFPNRITHVLKISLGTKLSVKQNPVGPRRKQILFRLFACRLSSKVNWKILIVSGGGDLVPLTSRFEFSKFSDNSKANTKNSNISYILYNIVRFVKLCYFFPRPPPPPFGNCHGLNIIKICLEKKKKEIVRATLKRHIHFNFYL